MNSSGFGYLLASISMIVGAIFTFPFTNAARKWGPVAINHFRLLVGLILLSFLVLILDKKSIITLFSTPSSIEYAYFCTSGIIGLVIGDYFGFHCMAILGAKRFSIFNTISPAATLAFGFILVGESINVTGLIGMAVSIAGMIWFIQASDTKEIEEHQVHEYGKASKGILFGILSGLCQGFHMALSKKAIISEVVLISPVHATWLRLLGATVGYFTFTFLTGKFREKVLTPVLNNKKIIPTAIIASIFGEVLYIVLIMWSLKLCKVAISQTILSLSPIVILPMAYFLYKEKMTFKTFVAGIVSVFGVFILIWRDDIATFLGLHVH